MNLSVNPSGLNGTVNLPPSKSITHRAFILGSLLGNESTIENALMSKDTEATLNCLIKMGAEVKQSENKVVFSQPISHGHNDLNCYNSGTSMRLLTGIASLFEEESILWGDDSLSSRPMGELVNSLKKIDLEISDTEGKPPVKVKGPISLNLKNHDTIIIKGSISSQFISSLLLTISFAEKSNDFTIIVVNPIVSKPYIDLTIKMLGNLGFKIKEQILDYQINFIISKSKPVLSKKYHIKIPIDLSAAAFFIAAACLGDNQIELDNINTDYPQADLNILNFISKAGGKVTLNKGKLIIKAKPKNGIQFNLSQCPDLFPVLCVLASQLKGETRLHGARQLKFKETDRIQTTCEFLSKMGVDIEPTFDGAFVRNSKLVGGCDINSYKDHRIAMAAAIAATIAEKKVKIIDAECVDISYNKFYDHLEQLGAKLKRDI